MSSFTLHNLVKIIDSKPRSCRPPYGLCNGGGVEEQAPCDLLKILFETN